MGRIVGIIVGRLRQIVGVGVTARVIPANTVTNNSVRVTHGGAFVTNT